MNDLHNYRQDDRVDVLFCAGPEPGTIEYVRPDMTLVVTMDNGGRTVVRAKHVRPSAKPEPAIIEPVTPPLPPEPTEVDTVVIVRNPQHTLFSWPARRSTASAGPHWEYQGGECTWERLVELDRDHAPVQVWPQHAADGPNVSASDAVDLAADRVARKFGGAE